jgi:hypothetical protein
MSEKDTIQTDTNTLVKEAQEGALSVKINSNREIESIKEEVSNTKKFWFWFAFWCIIIGGTISVIVYKYKKDNWV